MNIAAFSSYIRFSNASFTASLDTVAGLSNGRATALIDAPIAIDFAISNPVLMPPDETMGIMTECFTEYRDAAVGMPQSHKRFPSISFERIFISFALYHSTAV